MIRDFVCALLYTYIKLIWLIVSYEITKNVFTQNDRISYRQKNDQNSKSYNTSIKKKNFNDWLMNIKVVLKSQNLWIYVIE